MQTNQTSEVTPRLSFWNYRIEIHAFASAFAMITAGWGVQDTGGSLVLGLAATFFVFLIAFSSIVLIINTTKELPNAN